MSEETPRLQLPYVQAAQAQKHVTVNRSLDRLDTLVNLSVKNASLTSAPTNPREGDMYIVPASSGGEWQAHLRSVAVFTGGAWVYFPPHVGMQAWVENEARRYTFNGSAWVSETPSASEASMPEEVVSRTPNASETRLSTLSVERSFSTFAQTVSVALAVPRDTLLLAVSCRTQQSVSGTSGWKLEETGGERRILIPDGPVQPGIQKLNILSPPLVYDQEGYSMQMKVTDGRYFSRGRLIFAIHFIKFSAFFRR